MAEQTIAVERIELISNIFGNFDENAKMIEKEFNVSLVSRGEELKITGDEDNVAKAGKIVKNLMDLASTGETISDQTVRYCILMVNDPIAGDIAKMSADCVCVTAKGRPVKAKTLGQKKYLEAIKKNTITISVGPAGTGKTYLAVAMAVAAFSRKEISKIVLTRPAVEAGEKLGFLPGDLQNKVDPYLRPLYDALFDMLGAETHQRFLEKGVIEVAPLAYMRGRTLDDSFIILDEAQNTTPEQMKMFLTRLGFNSKAIITGDVTQIDLPEGKLCGLKEAVKILKNIDDIAICYLSDKDVVRHHLVQKIVKAYQAYEEAEQRKTTRRK